MIYFVFLILQVIKFMPEANCRPFRYKPAKVSEIHCAVFSHLISLKTLQGNQAESQEFSLSKLAN